MLAPTMMQKTRPWERAKNCQHQRNETDHEWYADGRYRKRKDEVEPASET